MAVRTRAISRGLGKPARRRPAARPSVEADSESGEPVEETEPEAEAATPKPKKTKKAPEWKSLPDAEKAQYLLDHQTLSDRTWTDELRLKGEKRDAFVRRILLGEVLHGEAVESDET